MSSAWLHFSPFADSTHKLLGVLAAGLDGRTSVTLKASKHGLTLYFGKAKVAHGRDARALFEMYDAVMEKICSKDYNGALKLLSKL